MIIDAHIHCSGDGLPVIATNVGGVIYIVEVGRTGLLNGIGDLKGMANNIATLMSDESMRAEMGKAARKRVEDKFELGDSTSQIWELLRILAQVENLSERSVGQN